MPGSLDHALLGLLHGSPSSGYDLRKRFETTPMIRFSASPGSVYPALRRLQRWGLIRGSRDQTTALRPRQVYRLTRSGHAALRAWLRQPITRADMISRREELCLRFAYMEKVLSRRESISFLEQYRREALSYSKSLSEYAASVTDAFPLHASLALELGIEGYRAHARWAKRALDVLMQVAPAKEHFQA